MVPVFGLKYKPKLINLDTGQEENILVVGAHSDDPIYGMGGTLIKLIDEGKNIYTIIMSYGEMSHPHLNREEIIKIRVSEAKKANQLIGGKEIMFYGLREGKFEEDFYKKHFDDRMIDFIISKKITKIFTHIDADLHPDHIATNKIVLDIYNRLPKNVRDKISIYGFDIWNVTNVKHVSYPKVYVKITKQLKKKLEAIKVFKSQSLTWFSLVWNLIIKSFFLGLKIKSFFAERFYKIK